MIYSRIKYEPKPTNLLLAGLKDKQAPNGTTSTKSSSSGLGLGSANQPSPSTQLAETNPSSHNNNPNIQGNTLNNNKHSNIDYSRYGAGFGRKDIDEMVNDKRFHNIMEQRVKINEGGYVNHPADRGGETKYGISSLWYPNEDIKNLTRERANMILYRDYWKNTNIYQLPDEFADIVLDDSIVQGQPTAIKNLQRALGVKDDGIIGADTLRSLKNANYKIIKQKFIENVKSIEEQYLNNDPSQRVFEKGHKRRFDKY